MKKDNVLPIVAIVGPTASGKSALAVAVAERLGTEIVSADSMQFYRGMEIGTAAPTRDELARVRHHFVGFLRPDEAFSAGAYEVAAREVVAGLNARGKMAVVVGGSGLYVSALIDGLFPGPGKDETVRARLQTEAEEAGVGELYARLESVDADYAGTINPNDLRRIVRALEVFELTGRPLSALHREHRESERPIESVQAGLDYDREELYARIDARVDQMIEQGLAAEVERLIDEGYGAEIERLRSLGYREIAAYLRGETSLEEAVELMKRNTRRYAKRQLTWFRGDSRIEWLKAGGGKSTETLAGEVLGLLEKPQEQDM
ncbi:MAG TPA: tRNA (adenosine(37)-N6)-dimethylallyltransferase MiaA [Candidatus Bathyarchaeia archaeon]|nr:tRNA (adenosine(37)-N6)-dimethylallyltransferase MiaA [Candidatus Bathyarchaeia archaeon]